VNARKGDYGIDAPYVPAMLGAVALLFTALGVFFAVRGGLTAVVYFVLAVLFLLQVACYLYTTREGKFRVWDEILDGLALRGDERAVDLGCGRGAVLLATAERLPNGRVVGVDLWLTSDQSGNAMDVTRANAEREGVADRVDLETGDMTDLPFADAAFDVVVSSLAIHNITMPTGRMRAIDGAVRVLRPGGRLALADIRYTADYESRLRDAGMTDVSRRALGWRFWFAGPWMATTLVTATKPSS
jgi:arsenite methyltransferase